MSNSKTPDQWGLAERVRLCVDFCKDVPNEELKQPHDQLTGLLNTLSDRNIRIDALQLENAKLREAANDLNASLKELCYDWKNRTGNYSDYDICADELQEIQDAATQPLPPPPKQKEGM